MNNNYKFQSIIFLLALFISVTILSCGNNKDTAAKDEFLINAQFTNSKGETLFLYELNVKDKVLLDSAKIDDNGTLTFRRKIKEPGFYLLYARGDNFITLLTDKGETINIKADIRQMAATYTVKGSKGSECLNEYESFTRANNKNVEKLSLFFDSIKNSPRIIEIQDSLDNEFKKILAEQKKMTQNFITKHNNSLATLIAINRRFRENVVLSEADDFMYFDLTDRTLSNIYPKNKHTIDHHQRVEKLRKDREESRMAAIRLEAGKKAPFFELISDKGEKVNLASFKGKTVLLYFWASWNASSRQMNTELKRIYKNFKKEEFEIIGVSLDNVKDVWKAAIGLDKPEWVQLNDVSGWDSRVAKDYYVKKMPQLTLIDPEGNIISNNITLLQAESSLNQLFK